jgi:hypothetical protein
MEGSDLIRALRTPLRGGAVHSSTALGILTLFRERGLKPPAVYEVRELLRSAWWLRRSGVCLVPVSVERLRRDNVVYRALDEERAFSPIIMSTRKGDQSPEITLLSRAPVGQSP